MAIRISNIQPDMLTAVRMFYEKPFLANGDIRELFGCSDTTAIKFKKLAVERMNKNGVPQHYRHSVDTKTAYEAWGLNVKQMETNLKKLKELEGLYGNI